LLNETGKQISPALTLVFQASINQDKVPEEWKSANITPLFKKGDRSAPVNYRPVSLTSVCSKVMEHIIHSHIIKHMDKHGFRKRRSIETQLILSIDALAKSLDVGEQVDCILLDFSNILLMKLQHYGVRGHLHDWITSFLLGRTQCVVLDGQSSAATSVSSEVPQGIVLFLLFINCLQMTVFCIEGLEPKRVRILQRDLDNLQQWENNWLMRFNPDKSEVLIATNK
jgi:hypothetical protein